MAGPRRDDDAVWPALPYADWKQTYTTLHMWTQVVGKVKLELTPFLNEWWNVTFAVTARGLTTATIPFGQRCSRSTSTSSTTAWRSMSATDGQSMPLVARSVADFYAEFMASLESLGIQVKINTHPVEVDDGIPFEEDHVHAEYDPRVRDPLVAHCAGGQSRCSSDTAHRSSARAARSSSGGARSTSRRRASQVGRRRRANGQHAGWRWARTTSRRWPASGRATTRCRSRHSSPTPSRAARLPRWRRSSPMRPFSTPNWREFILPYERVRVADDPDRTMLDFYRSTYEIGATLAGWDRAALERAEVNSSQP